MGMVCQQCGVGGAWGLDYFAELHIDINRFEVFPIGNGELEN